MKTNGGGTATLSNTTESNKNYKVITVTPDAGYELPEDKKITYTFIDNKGQSHTNDLHLDDQNSARIYVPKTLSPENQHIIINVEFLKKEYTIEAVTAGEGSTSSDFTATLKLGGKEITKAEDRKASEGDTVELILKPTFAEMER